MKIKTLEQLDEMSRLELLKYIEGAHELIDRSQRELTDSVREELDLKFAYDALRKRYNALISEVRSVLIEMYGVSLSDAHQIVSSLDKLATEESTTYPIGGCSG